MSKLLTFLIAFVLGAVVAAAAGFYSLSGFMVKEYPSPYAFEETVEKVQANAKGLGWKLPKSWKVNFQKNLQKVVKVDIGPNQVIGMCEPQAAADILKHDNLKRIAVMMPCRVAVYQKSDGKTYVSIMNMNLLGAAFGDVIKGITQELAPQMEKMVTFDSPE